ncbi:type I restriction enzyme S subunit [Cellulomonas cellasea]|uniref:Type I restriction enzyme S subunit n=1 Tax=Cellulomonas cellasea TaxID=43670 RepID=A0A7W4YBX9_9CELL|nr:type I restriction enzyme S subunit [Cellulomonas cellasea]
MKDREGGFPVLRLTAIRDGRVDLEQSKEGAWTAEEARQFVVRSGDMLVVRGNGSRSLVGRAGVVGPVSAPVAYPDTLIRVRPSADIVSTRFLALAWHSTGVREQIEAAARTTAGIYKINQRDLASLVIPVPPLDEQRRIVDILEGHLSRLDAADAYATAAARGLGRASAAQLTQLVSDSDPTARLSALATSSGYGTSTKCAPDGAGPAVVRIPNIKRGAIDLGDEKRVVDSSVDVSGLMLSEDDLLIVRTNGSRDLIGRTAVVQGGIHASFASYLIRYRFDPDLVLAEWVHQMLARPAARAVLEGLAASSAGQYNLSLGKLDRVEIAVPPVTEQTRRLSAHRETTYAADRIAASVEAVQTRSKKLRRALLAAAFSGRLSGQPSDLEIAEEMAHA